MTEAEVIELINMHASNAMHGFSIYITLTSGYLTAMYLVAAKISRLQITIISSLYGLSAGGFLLTTVTHLQSYGVLVDKYPDYVYSIFWHLPWPLMVYILHGGGILASLYFAYDIRSKIPKNLSEQQKAALNEDH